MRYLWIGMAAGVLLVVGAVLGVLALVVGVHAVASPAAAPITAHVITYRMSGTARRGIVDFTGEGTSRDEVPIPWESTAILHTGDELYFSVENATDTGTITCEVLVDNVVVTSSTHAGAFKRGACMGTTP